MKLEFAGSRESVIRSLEQLHTKDWPDVEAALVALRSSSWADLRAELTNVKPRWWRRGYQEIWVVTTAGTVRIFYSKRPA